LDKQPGLIDLFIKFKEACHQFSPNDEIPNSFFEELNIDKFVLETDINNLFLMPAGQLDDLYPTKVNTFNWEELFNQNPSLISGFANYLAKNFKYVLIDSRTGFTDISSICTSLMPEKLVVVFTPNKQSLTGVLGLVERVTTYRKKSDDLRPLVIFPLPSRIENAELDLQKDWRFGNKKSKIEGYQPQFEAILNKVYDLPTIDLTDYFDDIQIQYVPRYSYGEEIAVLSGRSEDRLSLARSYENFVNSLVNLESPWEYQRMSVEDNPASMTVGDVRTGGVTIRGNANIIYIGNDNTVKGNVVSNRQMQIFLCHASQDKPLVRDLYNRLASDGYDVWLDAVKLLPGQDWNLEIKKAVQASDVVLVCLSNQSVTKEGYVQKELRYALDLAIERPEGAIFIVPVRLDECEVPSRIRSWQYVDYFPNDAKELAYERIKKSLSLREASLGITHPKSKK
jgi:cellulose biosynthesis protein BcsQ